MTNVLKKRSAASVLFKLAIFLFLLNAVCKYFFPSSLTKVLPIMALACAIISYNNKIHISIKNIDILFICFGIVWFIGCIYSTSFQKGFGFVLSFFLSLLFSMIICTRKLDTEKIVLFLAFVCSVFSVLVIIQPIVPNLIHTIVSYLPYTYAQIAEMNYWSTRLGMYSGIFPDRAAAAFFSSILIGCGLYFLYKQQNDFISKFEKIRGVLFIVIGSLSLLMTAKRGHLVAAAFAGIMTYIVYKKAKHKSVLKIVLATVILVTLGLLIISNIDAAQVMLERFNNNDNFYTNRLDIYDNIYKEISENPILGTGTASAVDVLGIGGHNIYLTVFMENGIFGFLLIILCVSGSIYYTLRMIYMQSQNHDYDYLPNLLFALFIQIFFMVYGFTGNPLYDNYIFYIYIFSLGLVKNCEIMYKNNLFINRTGKK
ncbi:MAG: O-antigen ligase family protein [Acutalibacteraceae bacterium]